MGYWTTMTYWTLDPLAEPLTQGKRPKNLGLKRAPFPPATKRLETGRNDLAVEAPLVTVQNLRETSATSVRQMDDMFVNNVTAKRAHLIFGRCSDCAGNAAGRTASSLGIAPAKPRRKNPTG